MRVVEIYGIGIQNEASLRCLNGHSIDKLVVRIKNVVDVHAAVRAVDLFDISTTVLCCEVVGNRDLVRVEGV